jgi:hypothetical protein
MTTQLFDFITVGDPRGPMLLAPMREEMARELAAARQAVDDVPEYYLDQDAAKDAFLGLYQDGDDSAARDKIREAFDMSAGFAKHFDKLLDHINTMSWAYWRLHRAERRAYGKEVAQ